MLWPEFAFIPIRYNCVVWINDSMAIRGQPWCQPRRPDPRCGRPKGARNLQESAPLVQHRYTLLEQVGNPQDWRFTWMIRDDVTLSSTCDFCGRSTLRVTYEVARAAEAAWICENCVNRYNIAADLDGEPLGPKAARDYAHGLTARLKQQTCLDIIRRVQLALPNPELEEAAVYFDRNVQLSPLHAACLFSAMVQLGEETNARVFEVQTRSKLHQQEFGDLADAERSLVWIALSPQQRRRLASLGFAPAGTLVRRGPIRKPQKAGILLAAPRIAVVSEAATLVPPPKK